MAYCASYGHFHHDFAKLDDTKYCSYRNIAQIDIHKSAILPIFIVLPCVFKTHLNIMI